MATIEGHIAGIRRMIEADTYCVDVLKQAYAVRKAIEKLESSLLEEHLQSCVPSGIREGREDQVVGELLELYALNNK
jgi:DNA-binding FrmR family transcriptional regulator